MKIAMHGFMQLLHTDSSTAYKIMMPEQAYALCNF